MGRVDPTSLAICSNEVGDVLSSTLILKISPPMQSWGVEDRFIKVRKTNRFPTKSGIVGLMAAALGWDRDDDLTELARLRMGVRIDAPGILSKDFQTTRKPTSSRSKKDEQEVSDRYFLQDAVFMVGLQSEDLGMLEDLEWALKHPAFDLFAGRKSFVLNDDFLIGVKEDATIEDVFGSLKWQGDGHVLSGAPLDLEVIMDDDGNGNDPIVLNDYPLSFDLNHREWSARRVNRSWIPAVFEVNEDDGSENDKRSDVMSDDMFMLGEEVQTNGSEASLSDSGENQ